MTLLRLPDPPSANRYYRVPKGMSFPILSREGRAYKDRVQEIAREEGYPPPGLKDVTLVIEYHPASKNRKDLDNINKAVWDALKGIAYQDDKQVVQCISRVGMPFPGGAVVVAWSTVGEVE